MSVDKVVGIHRNFDGDYAARSNGKKATFRLIVHQGREKEYLAKGTNLDVNRSIVVKWYDKVRTPIETSYKLIKSFLIFTSSRSWLFRLFIFVLAINLYTILTPQGDNEQGRFPLTPNYLALAR